MQKYVLELKNRLFLIIYFFIFNTIFFYFYKEFLLFLLVKITYYNLVLFPFKSSYYFIFTNVTEIFSTYFYLIFGFIIQFLIYFVLFQIFCFLSPAFFKNEYYKFCQVIYLSLFFLFLSLFISYFLFIPTTWNFFLEFYDYQKNLYFEIKLLEYLNFCKEIYFYCVLYFQIYVLIWLLFYYNLNIHFIRNNRKKWFYFLSVFILSISSPDLFLNQLISWVIFFIVFEIILIFFLFKQFIF